MTLHKFLRYFHNPTGIEGKSNSDEELVFLPALLTSPQMKTIVLTMYIWQCLEAVFLFFVFCFVLFCFFNGN